MSFGVKLRVGFLFIVLCLLVVMLSCRRNQPVLVDRNRPPETELWYSPPDSSEYDYLVHIYWRGLDPDGTVSRYIWSIEDSIIPPPLGWNPAIRVADLRRGRFTTRTDSLFSFTAFRNVGGVGLKKNRQAFYISAIDDNGVMDPQPAVTEFIATVEKLPEVKFTLWIPRLGGPTPFNLARLDTIGMFRPFSISYHGTTTNGEIREYRFFPLTEIDMEGSDVWTADLSDTLRVLPNAGPDALPSGRFRLAAQVRDDAGAESPVDAGRFERGVAELVVNFEPDTRIFKVLSTRWVGTSAVVDSVDFRDSEPDTVAYNSWLKLFYLGWDNPADSSLCQDPVNECIRYQVQYTRVSDVDGGPGQGGQRVSSTVRWVPGDSPAGLPGEDNNPHGRTDTTTMSIGSDAYTIRVRSLDEYEKPDGTPDEIDVVGNFEPTIDSFEIIDHDGNVISDGDTVLWDWWNPANFHGGFLDTLDISDPFNVKVVREFFFVIKASGHDSPKEGNGGGIASWRYDMRAPNAEDPNAILRLFKSNFWTDGSTVNAFADTVLLRRVYRLDSGSQEGDPGGMENYKTLPPYLNTLYDIRIRGRDAAELDEYEQIMFINGNRVRLNSFKAAAVSRWTGVLGQRFYLRMRR